MRRLHVALLLLLLTPAPLLAAGHVFNANFSVLSPPQGSRAESQAYAQQVLEQSERYRKEIAKEWLGGPLPKGVGRTHINVAFSDDKDAGLTWPSDGPRRPEHRMFLATTPELALGSTLKHEICHAVFATRFPQAKQLPRWIEEGIASRYDDSQRTQTRQDMLRWWADTGNWPRIQTAIDTERLSASDQQAYCLASSLVDFLLTRGDKQKLISFAQGARGNLSKMLLAHYQIRSVDQLQTQWQAWAVEQVKPTVRIAEISTTRR